MILTASIIAFGAVAWIIASAIRNAHVCTCDQPECGGGCATQAEEPHPMTDEPIPPRWHWHRFSEWSPMIVSKDGAPMQVRKCIVCNKQQLRFI